MATVDSVTELWRFPVKSMKGEQLHEVTVTERGVLGDRAYALIDAETGKVASANVTPPTETMEFTGVRYLGSSRVNHGGNSPSHPATIGSRVLPANITLDCARRTHASTTIVAGARTATAPKGRKPVVSTCGIGAMRSI